MSRAANFCPVTAIHAKVATATTTYTNPAHARYHGRLICQRLGSARVTRLGKLKNVTATHTQPSARAPGSSRQQPRNSQMISGTTQTQW